MMSDYKTFLSRKYKSKTTLNYLNNLLLFNRWKNDQHLKDQQIKPKHIIHYLDYCRSLGNSDSTVNIKLKSINMYFRFLQYENRLEINPSEFIETNKKPRNQLKDILTDQELDHLYKHFKSSKRNRIILSLMIHQGLSVKDFDQLDVADLDLINAKIKFKGHSCSKERELELKPFQIIELHDYITISREQILMKRNKEYGSKNTDRLIISTKVGQDFKHIGDYVILELRKQFSFFKSFGQIRKSVISIWVGQFNLRQVQYMSGYKYVSSVEKFKVNHIEDLSEQVDKFHPMDV